MSLKPSTRKTVEETLGPHAGQDLCAAVVSGGGGSGSTTWSWFLAVGIDATVGGAGLWRVVQADTTFSRVDIAASTAPVGAAMVADIELSTDGGSTWSSLWASTQASRPRILAAAHAGNSTSFGTASASAGNLLRASIVSVGSSTPGRDITLQLRGS